MDYAVTYLSCCFENFSRFTLYSLANFFLRVNIRKARNKMGLNHAQPSMNYWQAFFGNEKRAAAIGKQTKTSLKDNLILNIGISFYFDLLLDLFQ